MTRLRRALVRGLVLAGLAALPLAGGLGQPAALVGLAGVAWGWVARDRPANQTFWRIGVMLAALFSALAPLLTGAPWGWSGVGLLVFLQVHRARLGESPGDDRLAVLFALLMVLLASVRSREPALGGLLALFVLGLPPVLLALRLAELERGRPVGAARLDGRWGIYAGISAASLGLTALFFFSIPRLDVQALSALGSEVVLPGYDGEAVELGALSDAKSNPALVMRVTVTDARGESLRGPFYFRGSALDTFDGRSWSASAFATRRVAVQRAQPEPARLANGLLRQELILEPLGTAPLFGIPAIQAVFGDVRASRERLGAVRVGEILEPLELVVWSKPEGAGLGPLSAGGDLTALPPGLDPRIRALAVEVAGAGDRATRAARLEAWLRQNMRYTLVPTAQNASQPLVGFLFETREGHCEFFATALAVLLRAVDIPAVLALGFYGGEYNEVGGYIAVRQTHAHAWVEAELEPSAWSRLDATPAGEFSDSGGVGGELADLAARQWQRWILDYDLNRQLVAIGALGGGLGGPEAGVALTPLPGVGIAALIAGAGLVFSRLRRGLSGAPAPERPGPAAGVYARALRLVARRGWRIPPALPPVEGARWLLERAGEAARPLEALAWIHYEERYSGRPDATRLRRAKAHLHELNDLPKAPEDSR